MTKTGALIVWFRVLSTRASYSYFFFEVDCWFRVTDTVFFFHYHIQSMWDHETITTNLSKTNSFRFPSFLVTLSFVFNFYLMVLFQ